MTDHHHQADNPALPPWHQGKPLLEQIRAQMGNDGALAAPVKSLSAEYLMIAGGQQVAFAPGMMDSIFPPDGDSPREMAAVERFVTLLKELAEKDELKTKEAIYLEALRQGSIVGIIDEVLTRIADDNVPLEPNICNFAKTLAFESPKATPVKLGIALLGLCNDETVMDDLKVLGLHDEFTLYVGVATLCLSDNPEQHLWELAKKVHGWGRIHLVQHLAWTDKSDIKQWLLTEGYRNDIMTEYLAYTCAVTGGLKKALNTDKPDDKVFKAAGELLTALIEGGPAEDIADYEDAHNVVPRYVEHAARRELTDTEHKTLTSILTFITNNPEAPAVLKLDDNEKNNLLIELHELVKDKN